ncbi:MAG: hypothetical protein JJE35_12155 [Thermoleophilia bacterium]|nr:hypothetical protein [Thermoleophilia bacterium]
MVYCHGNPTHGEDWLPGYRWHWIAQLWRRRPIGEILNATTTRSSLALLMRQARGDRGAMPPEFVDLIWDHWDAGTQAAILALYRGADSDQLTVAGRALASLTCPSLVIWADRDPYPPLRFGGAYAHALPNATLEVARGTGHWPLDRRPHPHRSHLALSQLTPPVGTSPFAPARSRITIVCSCLALFQAFPPGCPKVGATSGARF